MKKLILLTIFVFLSQIIGWSNSKNNDPVIELLQKEINELKVKDTSFMRVDSIMNYRIEKLENIPQRCFKQTLSNKEWAFVYCPIVLLIIYTGLFSIGIYRDKKIEGLFKSMFLASENSDTIIVPGKFVVFIGGMTAVIISLFVLSFFAYILIAQCDNNLDVSNLWKLIAALGIGVIPYGFYIFSKGKDPD